MLKVSDLYDNFLKAGHLTWTALCAKAGVTPRTLQLWRIKANSRPHSATVAAVARALDCSEVRLQRALVAQRDALRASTTACAGAPC